MVRSLALVLLVLSLAACSAQPTPTPDVIATQVVQAQAVAATLTAAALTVAPEAASPVPPTPTESPTAQAAPSRTPLPTSTPYPQPTKTPEVPPTDTPSPTSSCPSPAQPPEPSQPTAFEDYAATLAAYLSAGASAGELDQLLDAWGARSEDCGWVAALDMTGDHDAEVIVYLTDPLSQAGVLACPPGDVLIFQCRAGTVELAYQARLDRDEEWDFYSFRLEDIADTTGSGLLDLVYLDRSCGAHTCWEKLSVVEWDGTSFRNRTQDMPSYPYPTFSLDSGVIWVSDGGIGSVGAGIQRSREEEWVWDGDTYVFHEEVVGPPLVLIHHAHDGDDALARGDDAGAASYFQHVLEDTHMDSGLFLDSEAEGRSVARAYARFKLIVTHAVLGGGQVEAQYALLQSEHPPGSAGRPFVRLGKAFVDAYLAYPDPARACDAVIAKAEEDPSAADLLYAGYANPEYDPQRLCDLP